MQENRNAPPSADESIDLTGLRCPLPIVKTSRCIKNLPAGSVLEIMADDGGILVDLPAWCEANGQTLLFLNEVESSGIYTGYVRKEANTIGGY